ncbi:MAG: flagellar motor protein MotB [Planctomycetaceae bacterium]
MQEDPPAGVPEWVVTYGDMMSLLLTFFIMLVSLSEVRADKKFRAVMEAVQSYMGYRTAPLSPVGENFQMNSMFESLQIKLGSFTDSNDQGGIKTRSIAGDDIRVYRTREGKTTQIGRPILFGEGDIALDVADVEQLQLMLDSIAGKPNKIELHSHVSKQPLPQGSQYADKYQFSFARGKAVFDYLIGHGVAANRIRITTASDLEGKLDEDQQLLDENRVEIFLLDAFTEEYIGPRSDR